MSQKGYSISAGCVALVLFAGTKTLTPLHNIPFYILCCVVFCVISFGTYLLLGKVAQKKPEILAVDGKKSAIIPGIIIALSVFWTIMIYCKEPAATKPLHMELLLRRIFPLPVWLALMAAGTALFLFLMRKDLPERTVKIRMWIRVVVTALFTCSISALFYAPNILEDKQGTIYHSHAYTATIINVAWLQPYSERITSNYGHYGILYLPFVRAFHKLFGMDYVTTVSVICVVLQAVSILAFAIVLSYFAKHDVIYYLALFGVGEYYSQQMRGGVFHQVAPHRLIFPALLLLLIFFEKKYGKKLNITALILLSLSIIWSTDVGIILCISVALTRWVDKLYDEQGISLKKAANVLLQLIIFLGIPFAAAYLITNFYNVVIAHGPWLDFEGFMFPLVSEKGYISAIEMVLPGMWDMWVPNCMLFLGAVAGTMLPALLPGKRAGKMYTVIFFMGISGLGIMTYYVNRPAEGCLFVNIMIILLLLAVFLQKLQNFYVQFKTKKCTLSGTPDAPVMLFMRGLVTFLLFLMAFDTLYSLPSALKLCSETIWQRNKMEEFAEYVGMQVPPQAVAFGMAVPELYSMIDRDTNLYTTDWGIHDMDETVHEQVRYELEEAQWIFCNMQSLYEMEEEHPGLSEQYELHELMTYNQYEFGFWIKK